MQSIPGTGFFTPLTGRIGFKTSKHKQKRHGRLQATCSTATRSESSTAQQPNLTKQTPGATQDMEPAADACRLGDSRPRLPNSVGQEQQVPKTAEPIAASSSYPKLASPAVLAQRAKPVDSPLQEPLYAAPEAGSSMGDKGPSAQGSPGFNITTNTLTISSSSCTLRLAALVPGVPYGSDSLEQSPSTQPYNPRTVNNIPSGNHAYTMVYWTTYPGQPASYTAAECQQYSAALGYYPFPASAGGHAPHWTYVYVPSSGPSYYCPALPAAGASSPESWGHTVRQGDGISGCHYVGQG
jgi:hypothetical protein